MGRAQCHLHCCCQEVLAIRLLTFCLTSSAFHSECGRPQCSISYVCLFTQNVGGPKVQSLSFVCFFTQNVGGPKVQPLSYVCIFTQNVGGPKVQPISYVCLFTQNVGGPKVQPLSYVCLFTQNVGGPKVQSHPCFPFHSECEMFRGSIPQICVLYSECERYTDSPEDMFPCCPQARQNC